MKKKTAFFRFDASFAMGAGHAIRSSVLADALTERGWVCTIVTPQATYDFMKDLKRFARMDPDDFYHTPAPCDLLVVDHYGLDQAYESHFRGFATKILVIDDLANRAHDCDVLLDPTYGRKKEAYLPLVPPACLLLTGVDYALLRKDFICLRPQALEKRRATQGVKKILVCMGGSDPQNNTLKALTMIQESGFEGDIDVVLGFQAPHREKVQAFLDTLPASSTIHIDADMPTLIYEADLAIGAAGSSVWERCCLGLPQIALQTADNQKGNQALFAYQLDQDFLKNQTLQQAQDALICQVDGLGVFRVLSAIDSMHDQQNASISHRRVQKEDMQRLFSFHCMPEIRKHSHQNQPATLSEHQKWFSHRTKVPLGIFEMILCDGDVCGNLRLDYDQATNVFSVNFYVIPAYQKRGIGSIIIRYAQRLSHGIKMRAFVYEHNVSSQNIFKKSGFVLESVSEKGNFYEYDAAVYHR